MDTLTVGSANYSSAEAIQIRIRAEQYIVHEDYVGDQGSGHTDMENDIALIKVRLTRKHKMKCEIQLDEPLNFTDSVRTICLSKNFDEMKTLEKSKAAMVAGWGRHDCEFYFVTRALQLI